MTGIAVSATEAAGREQDAWPAGLPLPAILDAVDALVMVLDPGGRIMAFTGACQAVTGYAPREARGRLFWDFLPEPAEAEAVRSLLASLDPGGPTARQEVAWIGKDGVRRRIVWRIVATGARGRIEHLVATGLDVTGQRAIQRAFRESEERFRRLSDLSLEGIAIHDRGSIVDANRTFAEMHGYEPSEVIGMNVLMLVAPEAHAQVAARMLENSSTVYECLNVRKDGTIFPTEIQGRVIRQDGRRLRVATIRDITVRKRAEDALRESEARLQAILDNSSTLIYLKDAGGRYLLANQRVRDLVGREENEIVGRTDHELTSKEIADARAANDAQVLQTGQAVKLEEVVRARDGGERTFISVKFPLKDASGAVYAIGGISTDITDRKRMEEALTSAKEAAVFASHAKSEFLANVSHELRTPLNAILGFSEMIRDQMFGPVGEPKYLEYADDIHRSGIHLLGLINDILDLSKVEAGQMELKEEDVDVPDLIESCTLLIRQRARQAGIGLSIGLAPILPLLRGDERKLKQVLINLLSNAVKFTPSGGRVEVHAGFDEQGAFAVTVRDTGVGIAPENIAKALAPFGQIENSLTRRHEGTGLGLPLAKMLCDLHGAAFELTSAVDVGTTARIVFPPERLIDRPA